MTENLYMTPLDQITSDSIINFCNENKPESIILDYKKTWPSNLAKTLCAFANTQGGIILIGVDETDNNTPKLPLIGVDGIKKELSQKIFNISYDAIYPPISPEVQVIKIESSSKYVILIRVLPSRLIHATDSRSKIYVRVDDHSRPEKLASLSELQWLWDRREEADSYRNSLIDHIIDRSETNIASIWKSNQSKSEWNKYFSLQLYSAPIFLDRKMKLDNPGQLLENVKALNSSGKRRKFPHAPNLWRTIPSGVILSDRGTSPNQQYIEFNIYGICFLKSQLRGYDKFENRLDPRILVMDLQSMLELINEFYSYLDWSIPIEINAELRHAYGRSMQLQFSDLSSENYFSPPCPSNDIELFTCEVRANTIPSELDNLVKHASNSLIWSFGSNLNIDEWFLYIQGKAKEYSKAGLG